MWKLLVLVQGLALASVPARAEVAAVGLGSRSCAAWFEFRETVASLGFQGWVAGYVTGAQAISPKWPLERVVAEVEKECWAHLDRTLATAVSLVTLSILAEMAIDQAYAKAGRTR